MDYMAVETANFSVKREAEYVETAIGDEHSASDGASEDSRSPYRWSYRRKMATAVLVSLMTTIDTLATVTCLPAVPEILSSFSSTNDSYSVLLVSIWEVGEGIGPFLMAPLSEVLGRLPVYHVANVLFLACTVAGALSVNLSMLIAFRFLNGFTVASLTLGPAIVGDMFEQNERGGPMAVLFIGPLLGPVLGPVIGGFVTRALGWRWTYWVIAIAIVVVLVPSFLFLRESYRVRSAKTPSDAAGRRARAFLSNFSTSVTHPFRLFLFSPVVFMVSIYMAIVYGYFYLILTTLAEVLHDTYGFETTSSGLGFLGFGIGMIIGVVLCGATSDQYMKSKGDNATPEHRLVLMVFGSVVLPLGLFLYAWTVAYHVHWIAPLIGTGIVGFGLMTTIIPAESYLVDAFTENSASAIAAAAFTRSMVGATFPLLGPPLYQRLGLGWGNSLLAFIAVGLIPVPVLLFRNGQALRRRYSVL